MCRQGSEPREHVSLATVLAKPSPPGTEEKLMDVDAREVDFVCVKERKRYEEIRVPLYFLRGKITAHNVFLNLYLEITSLFQR